MESVGSSLQEKAFMMLRNMATTRSAKHCIKHWSQGAVVPALVAILQAARPSAQAVLSEQIVLHILKTLVNFAATGLACFTSLRVCTRCAALEHRQL